MKKKNLVVGKQAQYNYDNISQRAKGFILSGSTNGFKEVYNGQRDHQSAYPGLCGIISWYTTTTRYTPNRDQAATMQEIKKKKSLDLDVSLSGFIEMEVLIKIGPVSIYSHHSQFWLIVT